MAYNNAVDLRFLGGCKPKPVNNRFYRHIHKSKDGCWYWLGTKRGSMGYGVLKVNKKPVAAHRYSYQFLVRKIKKGMLILHKCDNVRCVNPKHLFEGTQKDNMVDCKNKGRTRGGTGEPQRGESNVNSKLTNNDIKKIRKMKISQREIASMFNVSQPLISKIKRREVWQSI